MDSDVANPQTDRTPNNESTLWVVTAKPTGTRGGRQPIPLKIDDLSVNVSVFLSQMEQVLSKTPDKLGKFNLHEFEVHAEVTAKGMIALLGTGGEAGATGGLKFVFRREGAK